MAPQKRPWSVMIDATAFYSLKVHVPATDAADAKAAHAKAAEGAVQPDLHLGPEGDWDIHSFNASPHYGGSSDPAKGGGFDVVLLARLIAARSVRVMAVDESEAVEEASGLDKAKDPPWPDAHGNWTLDSIEGFEVGDPEEREDGDTPDPDGPVGPSRR